MTLPYESMSNLPDDSNKISRNISNPSINAKNKMKYNVYYNIFKVDERFRGGE